MEFVFFDCADNILFVRSDGESGTWTQEEMTLVSLFPFDPDKEIERGMRVGFRDEFGTMQVFEIRKVRNYEPDHYQEITAEHIAVAELTDEFFNGEEFVNVTAGQALTTILSGTQWAVGNVSATNTSSVETDRGNVWHSIKSIEQNWNVLIIPRVVVGASGVTGRYLDVMPNAGTWRGLRLSLEKNADEMGVTIDDSEVCTAMYGFGHSVEGTGEPLTFADVVWTETSDHPAKPNGQTYIEDPVAKALFGRNGRNRFSYYQNADIENAETLLQKTLEMLQTCNSPKISIDCLVRDLYRMGYQDQPIRLHDKAIVEVRQWGKTYTLDVIRLSVDLFDPTATRVTIGAYIPNIIYYQRDTEEKAGGGGGGGRGQTKAEYERQEFETAIEWNEYQISLRAYQNDLESLDGVVRQAQVQINAQGVQISAMETDVDDLGERVTSAESSLSVMAGQIESKVSAGDIASTINQTAQSVLIQASKINLEGYVTADYLAANTITVHGLTVSGGGCNLGNSNVYVNGNSLLNGVQSMTLTNNGGVYTLAWSTFGGGSYSENFSSAQAVTLSNPTWASNGSSATYTVTASNGASKSQLCTLAAGSWSSGSRAVQLLAGGSYVATLNIYLPTSGTWSSDRTSQSNLRVYFTLAGKTYQSDFGV
jgi:phage minor structural protein